MHHSTDKTAFVTSHGVLAGMRNSSMGSLWANALSTELHIAPFNTFYSMRISFIVFQLE